MNQKDRQRVFEKFGGKCAYCGIELTDKWQIDHAVSKRMFWLLDSMNPKSVNVFENLMPSCVPCNHYKRTLSIYADGHHYGFKDYMLSFHKRFAKLPKKPRIEKSAKRIEYMKAIADRYGITASQPFKGVFYFETYKSLNLNLIDLPLPDSLFVGIKGKTLPL